MKKTLSEILQVAILFALAMLAINSCRAQTQIIFHTGDKPVYQMTVTQFIEWETSADYAAKKAAYKMYASPAYMVTLPFYSGGNFKALQVRRNLTDTECAAICGCTVTEWQSLINNTAMPFSGKEQIDAAYQRLRLMPKKTINGSNN
jgi:hypothetical protein